MNVTQKFGIFKTSKTVGFSAEGDYDEIGGNVVHQDTITEDCFIKVKERNTLSSAMNYENRT